MGPDSGLKSFLGEEKKKIFDPFTSREGSFHLRSEIGKMFKKERKKTSQPR